ncbi:MAG: FtsX-like permease family protein, partial [Chloroflexi bacterium]|nr:FtsX-like permease family protein [Chloroflexota bacterium]
MDEMFGLSMNLIMFVLLGLLAITLGAILIIFIRNRIVFLMGLRNIPRRVAQSTLIVIGLMLSTVIITAAFAFGDTVDYSITKATYDLFGHADIILESDTGPGDEEDRGSDEISGDAYEAFLAAADASPSLTNVDGYMGLLFEPVPVINVETGLSEPDVLFTGIDAERTGAFPDVIDAETGESLSVTNLGANEVYLNESAADELRAVAGSVLTVFVSNEPHDFTVQAIVEDRASTGALNLASPEGMVASLDAVHELFGSDNVSAIAVSVNGGVRDTLEASPEAERQVRNLVGAQDILLRVTDTKAESVDEAEEIGNFMTTFFLLLGLFSIGAGVLLIVMIFVMLAAERKPEMGMARAVGMKRQHLVEMFVAEGTGYNLASAVVGVGIGVAVAFALTTAASAVFSSLGFTFTPHVTLRTIVISYCLGVVLTFLTVTFSSWRVSTLNIVSAIRDTPEGNVADPESGTVRGLVRAVLNVAVLMTGIGLFMLLLKGEIFAAPRERRVPQPKASMFPFPAGVLGFPIYQLNSLLAERRQIPVWPSALFLPGVVLVGASGVFGLPSFLSILAVVAGIAGVFIALAYFIAVVVYRLTRDHRPEALPWWLMAPGAILPVPIGMIAVGLQNQRTRVNWSMGIWTPLMISSVFLVMLGLQSDTAFPFALGVTLITVGATVCATYFGAPARPAYTAMSLFLLLFWGFTAGNRLEWIFGTLDGDIEMFFLSGVAMVMASTFFIIYNLDILLAFLSRVGGAFGSILPSLRTAVAYPMANRFRTGMTLAMISLVVFSLTMMSVMNLNYDKLFLQDESRGGWDVQVVENPNNPLPGVKQALQQGDSPVADQIAAEGAIEIAGFDTTEVRQGAGTFDEYPVRGLTNSFIESGSVPIDKVANGYADADAVWEALLTEPDAAIIDGFAIQGGFNPNEFSISGIDTREDTFDQQFITVRDSGSGVSRSLRVIGVITLGASANFTGIFTGSETFQLIFGPPELSIHFVALTNPDDSRDVARDIEAALVTTGAQAESLQEIAEENNALSRNFLYLMQAFMGLGLFVGIAAVGVIAFRSVVERRQQIGMLRAIGYTRGTVALSFILESTFVAALGVLSGVGLAIWLSYFLITSDEFPASESAYAIPWLQIALISAFA